MALASTTRTTERKTTGLQAPVGSTGNRTAAPQLQPSAPSAPVPATGAQVTGDRPTLAPQTPTRPPQIAAQKQPTAAGEAQAGMIRQEGLPTPVRMPTAQPQPVQAGPETVTRYQGPMLQAKAAAGRPDGESAGYDYAGERQKRIDEARARMAPAAQAPAAEPPPVDPNAPVALENLAGVIEKQLGQPSGFGTEQAGELRDFLMERRRQEFEADAARRGMTFSTVPQVQMRRAATDIDTQLQSVAALRQGEDLTRAIQNAMQFGGMGMAGQQAQDQLAMGAGQMGLFGGPTIPGSLGNFPVSGPAAMPPNQQTLAMLGRTMGR